MKTDRLTLKSLDFFGLHGTDPWEKEVGRRFNVDVELTLDLEPAGKTDALEKAVDYRDVYTAARDVVAGESHELIERIAWRLVEEMFGRFPAKAVRVVVRKPEAPIGGLNEATEVEFTRAREEYESSQSKS
jgi:dihydroneopterin aldolase